MSSLPKIVVKVPAWSLWREEDIRNGRIYPQRGPCSEKNVGPFTSKKLATFLVITVRRLSGVSSPAKLTTFFAHYSRGLPIIWYFGHAKKFAAAFAGAPFLWGQLFGRTC